MPKGDPMLTTGMYWDPIQSLFQPTSQARLITWKHTEREIKVWVNVYVHIIGSSVPSKLVYRQPRKGPIFKAFVSKAIFRISKMAAQSQNHHGSIITQSMIEMPSICKEILCKQYQLAHYLFLYANWLDDSILFFRASVKYADVVLPHAYISIFCSAGKGSPCCWWGWWESVKGEVYVYVSSGSISPT